MRTPIWNIRPIRRLFAASLVSSALFGGASPSRAEPLRDGSSLAHVTLSWAGAAPATWSDSGMTEACSRLGESLVAGGGLWGLGAFRSYGCYIEGRLIAGKAGASTWLVALTPSARDFSIAVLQTSGGQDRAAIGPLEPVYDLRLTPPQWVETFMQDDAHVRLLAGTILFSLPAAGRLQPQEFAARSRPVRSEAFEACLQTPVPPRQVAIAAEVNGAPVARGDLKADPKGETWKFSEPRAGLAAGAMLIVSDDAPGVRKGLESCALAAYRSAIESVDSYALDRFDGAGATLTNYVTSTFVAPFVVGVRYGVDVQGSEVQFGRAATLVSAVAESRWGVLDGLQARYEIIPTLRNDRTQLAFGVRRLQLGWSFRLKMPAILDHVDLTPKAGLWNVESTIVLADPIEAGKTYTVPVRLHRAWGAGLEAGAEFSGPWFVVRGWASRDATLGGENKVANSVVGTRLGLDAVFNAKKLGGRRSLTFLSPLAFVLRESMAITGNQGGVLQREDVEIRTSGFQVSYVMTYAGFGLAVVW